MHGLSLPFGTAGGNATADCEISALHYRQHANTSVTLSDSTHLAQMYADRRGENLRCLLLNDLLNEGKCFLGR